MDERYVWLAFLDARILSIVYIKVIIAVDHQLPWLAKAVHIRGIDRLVCLANRGQIYRVTRAQCKHLHALTPAVRQEQMTCCVKSDPAQVLEAGLIGCVPWFCWETADKIAIGGIEPRDGVVVRHPQVTSRSN